MLLDTNRLFCPDLTRKTSTEQSTNKFRIENQNAACLFLHITLLRVFLRSRKDKNKP